MNKIFRLKNLCEFGRDKKLPVIAWGNGACNISPWEHLNFLSEVASHGFLVIAIGPMPKVGEQKFDKSESSLLIDAIDWAIAQKSNRDSPYYGKIATESICVSGLSGWRLYELFVDTE